MPIYCHHKTLIGRMAALGVPQADVAVYMDIHPTQLNAILRGRRQTPEGFEEKAHAVLDRLERAEAAAEEARRKVLEETE